MKQKTHNNVKLLLDFEEDEILDIVIDKAESSIKAFCNITELSDNMQDILEDLVLFRLSVLGREGVKSEGMGSLSLSLNDDFPQYIKQKLYAFRKLRTM